jgi:diaminopimelate decarboxylase/aspartate kinase
MRSLLHKLSDVWAMFGRERVHLISQSSNDLNLTFVIDEADADGMLPLLHEALIESGAMPADEASVFGPSWREINGAVRHRGVRWWSAPAARERLLSLAQGETPRYVYNLDVVRARARALMGIAAVDRRFFAIKANSHPSVLRTLVEEGFGLECVSRGELERVFEVAPSLPMERVLFTPSFAPRAEYAFALERGINVTLDNVEALQQWPEVFRGRRLWLRVDLGRGDGHHDKVKTGGKSSKFGLPLTKLDEFVAAARAIDVRITGLHAHLGSGVESAQHWNQIADELGGLADQIGTIETIDIGGGLPIPYAEGDEPFDLAAWGEGLAAIKAAYPAYQLVIEPGRYLVAESGVLLAMVTQVVEKLGIRRVGSDAGMHTLIRPALYDAWHDVANLSRLDDTAQEPFDVVGPICESSDIFGKRRKLASATAEGDVLLFSDAGAYGYVMASHYNLRGLPAEDVIDGVGDVAG